MRLLHYSTTPLRSVYSVSQDTERQRYRADKPNGLWVSVEGEADWYQWCHAEDWGLDRLTVATEVVLAPGANILHVSKEADLRAFSARYVLHPEHSVYMRGIDWERVAREFQGIIIAPYQWSCRIDRDLSWYYSWDCASGCIWDSSAVAELLAANAERRAS